MDVVYINIPKILVLSKNMVAGSVRNFSKL